MADAEVSGYLRTQKFADCKLPVTTAMYDNFKGWGNFSETNLGLKANICLAHVTGNIRKNCLLKYTDFGCRRYCGGEPLTCQAVTKCCCL